MRSLPLLVVLFVVSLFPIVARAQWQVDGAPVSTAVGLQGLLDIVSDGAGGAIIVWEDERNGATDIYAQRMNALGVPQWTPDGVAICTLSGYQFAPRIASDGAGGAIITWEDARSGGFDIYAQRVSASGGVLWTANGVALSVATFDQRTPEIVSDGAGGAIVAWTSFGGVSYDIYARRVNAMGVPQWTADGVALCTAAGDQYYQKLVSDGAAGAIVIWVDYRGGVGDIYARRINSSGVAQWTSDGVGVCTNSSEQLLPVLVSDGSGGAIAAWEDQRADNGDIYVQRINGAGSPQWYPDGEVLAMAINSQGTPTITSDGTGGAIVAWEDFRSGTTYDIYAHRVSPSGAPLWTAAGVAIANFPDTEYAPKIISDGKGGAIVTWVDDRNGFDTNDVYAQRLNALGAIQWTAFGVPVTNATNSQLVPAIASDGADGAIVAWVDRRSNPSSGDTFAQRVEGRFGYWGHPEPIIKSVADVPKDEGGKVAVNWSASGRDLTVPRAIDHYTVWRAVDVVPLNETSSVLTDISRVPADANGPLYASLPTSDYYWELVSTQAAHGWAGYSFSASTRADSVSGNAGDEYFMVAAHYQYDYYVAFSSNVLSGHSVDNLAPAAPLYLVAQRNGADVHLHWNRVRVPDLREYSVYRATSSGVTPVPINFLGSAGDTVLVDASAPTSALYYIVTAHDVHANQSPPSNEASVGALTSVGNMPPIYGLTVLDNVPNPFGASTTLRVGLPGVSEIEVDVYDVAGRRVQSERTVPFAAGWREIPFDARDATGHLLPSGVYFYRVRAAGQVVTRKMVIAR